MKLLALALLASLVAALPARAPARAGDTRGSIPLASAGAPSDSAGIDRAPVLAPTASAAAIHSASAGDLTDPARVGRLREYVDRLEAFGFSGQILVAENGRIAIERACGFADRRFGVRMTPETRLAVGSVTKSFVAAALLRLEAQGQLRLDDPLGRHLEEVPADKAAIRLDQLLSHTGGVALDVPDGVSRADRDELVRRTLAEPLIAAPGERFSYSNAGLDLAAAVVERVWGTSFDEFARRELWTPAGMTATGIAGQPATQSVPAARGVNEWKEVGAWADWPAGWTGTGSGRLVTTAGDLGRWLECMRSGRVLTARQWTHLATPHGRASDSMSYGLGMWLALRPSGPPVRLIGGEVEGYRADSRLYPDEERIVVVLSNQDGLAHRAQCRTIANTLSRLAQGLDPPVPPATRAPSPGGTPEVVGAWETPGGGRIEIWEEGGALRLGARGQEALDRFDPDGGDSTGARLETLRRTEALMRALVGGDSVMARAVLSPAEFELGYAYLSQHLRVLGALHQGLQGVTGLGVVALPGWSGELLSYVSLRFARRIEDLCLTWRRGRLAGVDVGEGRPFPVLLPVAPLAAGGWAAFDAARHHTVPLAVRTGGDGRSRLSIGDPDTAIEATRVR